MAISFTKTTWVDLSASGPYLEAAQLNRIENAIESLVTLVGGSFTAGRGVYVGSGGQLADSPHYTVDTVQGIYSFGGSQQAATYPGRAVKIRGVGASYRSPAIELIEQSADPSWAVESYFGTLRFVRDYSGSPSVKGTLDASGNVDFAGNFRLAGTQRISSAGRFDASSIYNSAWAGGGIRPLLTDHAGMGYATDAATFRTAIGAQGSLGGAANSFVYTDGAGNVVVSNNDTPKTLSHTSSRFQTDDGVGYWTMMAYSGNLDFRKGSSYAGQSVAARMTLTSFDFPSGGTYKIGGVQVVTSRSTGWVAMTGSSNSSTAYDTSSVTLAQLAGRVMALQAALTTHGLIGA